MSRKSYTKEPIFCPNCEMDIPGRDCPKCKAHFDLVSPAAVGKPKKNYFAFNERKKSPKKKDKK